MTADPASVLETVVRHDYCCNCGMCAAVCPRGLLDMRENEYGECRPAAATACDAACKRCLQVCPFSNAHGEDEDSLGRQRFAADPQCVHHQALGWVRDAFAGGVADASRRLEAPSGGLASALLCRLLHRGEIDAAVVVEPVAGRPWHRSRIATNCAEVLASRGSAYHAAPFDRTIAEVLNGPERRYAVVALPCAAKAIRLAQRRLPVLDRRIRYVLGLTCGGYRSLAFPEVLTALMGCREGLLRYRSKRRARHAHDYRAELLAGGSVRSVRMLGLFGFLWINDAGLLPSCLFCDDVFAETADAVFMDAWLPEYEHDRRGTSLTLVRDAALGRHVASLFDEGVCLGGRVAPQKVAQSQAALVARRRRWLAARCRMAEAVRGYAPRKREGPAPAGSPAAGRQASRQLLRYARVRRAMLRFRRQTAGKPVWLARLYAWRLCGKILCIAAWHRLRDRRRTAAE